MSVATRIIINFLAHQHKARGRKTRLDIQNYGRSGNLLCYNVVVVIIIIEIKFLFKNPKFHSANQGASQAGKSSNQEGTKVNIEVNGRVLKNLGTCTCCNTRHR